MSYLIISQYYLIKLKFLEINYELNKKRKKIEKYENPNNIEKSAQKDESQVIY